MGELTRRSAFTTTLEYIIGASLALSVGCETRSDISIDYLAREISGMGFEVVEKHEAQNSKGTVVLYGGAAHGLMQSYAINLFKHLKGSGINLALSEGYSGKYNGQDFEFEKEISGDKNAMIFGIDNDELSSLAENFSLYNIAVLNNLGNPISQEQQELGKIIIAGIKNYDESQIEIPDFRENYLKYDNKYKRDERSIRSAREAARVMAETGVNNAFMIYGANHEEVLIQELNNQKISVLFVMPKNIRIR